MAATEPGPDKHEISASKAMAGILALLIDQREARVGTDKSTPKTEVLLDKTGLSYEDIATVTGKKPDAVRMAVHRAKAK